MQSAIRNYFSLVNLFIAHPVKITLLLYRKKCREASKITILQTLATAVK